MSTRTARHVILFEFAGRRGNVELQLPLLRRIHELHPHVEIQLWNLTRNNDDDAYLRSLDEPGIEVIHRFAGPRADQRINRVWRHYAQPRYEKHDFVKLDDDVVFLQTDRFGTFLAAIRSKPGAVISAMTINNGACTPLLPGLLEGFETLGIPLLDVHLSNAYAELAHMYMFSRYPELLDATPKLIENDNWLSINCIGMNWHTLARIANRLGHASPTFIAGRHWHPRQQLGDEGSANMERRYTLRGFLTAHLGFGPQKVTAEQERRWRAHYADIGAQHLMGVPIGTPT